VGAVDELYWVLCARLLSDTVAGYAAPTSRLIVQGVVGTGLVVLGGDLFAVGGLLIYPVLQYVHP
jgi:hypothetical protein